MPHHIHILPQPNPPKQQYNRRKEAQPRLPPNARTLRHSQHAIHRALEADPRILKLIIHLLRQARRIANLISNKVCQLNHLH
jgi:hypothetical protein